MKEYSFGDVVGEYRVPEREEEEEEEDASVPSKQILISEATDRSKRLQSRESVGTKVEEDEVDYS